MEHPQSPPDDLAGLVKSKGPVDIDAIAEAYARSLPTPIKESLASFLIEGPLDQVWCFDLLHIENFPSDDARGEYCTALMETYLPGNDQAQASLLAGLHIRRDVNRHIIDTVRCRLLDALFRDANRNRGSGLAVALAHLVSGTVLEQENALLAMLRAFGLSFLTDPSLPIIGQRHHELTRGNRKFARDCATTLTTCFRKEGKPSHDQRQRDIFWLALRPEQAQAHLNGSCTSAQLKRVMVTAGGKPWNNEYSKTFNQFVRRNFADLKAEQSPKVEAS